MTGTAFRYFGEYTRVEMNGIPPSLRAKLTRRQTQVAALVAEGWPTKRIASELKIGEATIRLYKIQILTRLGLDRTNTPEVEIARAVIFAWADAA